MLLQLVPITPEEQPAVVEFLLSAFQLPAEASFVDPARLRWKNFEPRPDWRDPRSYVLKRGDRIVAHGCIYPVTFISAEGEVSSMRIIDWASSPGIPGSGALLFRKLAAFADTAFAVGGSRQTQEIMPKIGFEHRGDVDVYARVVRPVRQFRLAPSGGWRGPLRLARNIGWSLRPFGSLRNQWQAVPISRPGELGNRTSYTWISTKRTPELLDYLLRCPQTCISSFEIRQGASMRGYFLLNQVRGQCRIIDIWINSEQPQDWQSAYSLAARTASRNYETCEITAIASMELARQALLANGFICRRQDPVFVHDPKELLRKPLLLNLLDGDEFFLIDPDYPFLT